MYLLINICHVYIYMCIIYIFTQDLWNGFFSNPFDNMKTNKWMNGIPVQHIITESRILFDHWSGENYSILKQWKRFFPYIIMFLQSQLLLFCCWIVAEIKTINSSSSTQAYVCPVKDNEPRNQLDSYSYLKLMDLWMEGGSILFNCWTTYRKR